MINRQLGYLLDMNNYQDAEYWDNRYSREEGKFFQWLETFETLKDLLQPCMTKGKSTKILNIGCGNSQIQNKLYEEGYQNITNNDISTVIIKQLKLTSKYQKMRYQVMDITAMSYKDKSFDVVIDKSTMDALFCSDSPHSNVAKMLHHIYRVLSDDGFYFIVSYGSPEQRMEHLKRPHINFQFSVRQIKVENKNGHYVYIGKKIPQQHQQEVYNKVLKQAEEFDESEYAKKQEDGQ